MAWPTNKTLNIDKAPDTEVKPGEEKVPEKTIAEQIAEAVAPFKEGFETMRAELETLRKPKPTPVAPTEPVSVLEDENAAFATRLMPVIAKQWEIEARMVFADVEKEYRNAGFGDLLDESRAKIVTKLERTDLARYDQDRKIAVPLRGDPDVIRSVIDMVIGEAVRTKGIKYRGGKEANFFLEDGTGESNFIERKPAASEGLTAKQVQFAKKMKIPVEQYRDSAKKLDFVV